VNGGTAGTILAMAAVTFAVRLIGLLVSTARVPSFWRRFLVYVPVAVFSALIVPGLPGMDATDSAWRVAAAAVTGLLVWRTRSLAPGLVGGLALYLVVRPSSG
jgi:branched-subunit amino acid transport protein